MRKLNTKGALFSMMSGHRYRSLNFHFPNLRYIDQCQDLLDAPFTVTAKDLDIYKGVVLAGAGELNEVREEGADEAFAAYVRRGSISHLERTARKDTQRLTASYDHMINLASYARRGRPRE
jgi:hypothetical protein